MGPSQPSRTGKIVTPPKTIMTGKFWLTAGALCAGVGIAAGAVGTHFLKEALKLPQAQLDTYEVAVRYQMYHAFGLMIVGLLADRWTGRLWSVVGAGFLTGIVLFSGGLYGWLMTDIKPLVHIVPVGGMIWIVAWLLLAVAVARRTGTHA